MQKVFVCSRFARDYDSSMNMYEYQEVFMYEYVPCTPTGLTPVMMPTYPAICVL